MFIKSVEIKNFRSIINEKIELNNIVVLIGNNDAGKSNYMKALNLFFNGQTDFNTAFNFEHDYCKYARVASQKAKEIIITVGFTPPDSFKEKETIYWKKVWRAQGEMKDKEKKYLSNKSEAALARSRANHWIAHLKYRYVPAIKSDQYFQELLGDLNDTLAESVEKDIKTASLAFNQKIQESTTEISKELSTRLSLDSCLNIPSDLRKIFQTLDFSTKYGEIELSLKNRGDGIKSRHIPVVLKFLAEQDNKSRTQGAPKIDTVWGFEEPENNLELAKAFELAKDFYDYSKSVQIILSTHSTAFYSIKQLDQIFIDIKKFNSSIITTYFVDKDTINKYSSKARNVDKEKEFVHNRIGLMPIISPYILDKVKEAKFLEEKYEVLKAKLAEESKPVLVTEGKTDPIILINAWRKLYPDTTIPLKIISCDTTPDSQTETAGSGTLKDALNSYRPDLPPMIGLFDRDDAGINAYTNLNNNFYEEYSIKVQKNGRCFALCIPQIPQKHEYCEVNNLPIEFLFPEECIIKKNKNGYGLEFRQLKRKVSVEGKIENEMDTTEPYYRKIVKNKVLFAKEIVPTFNIDEFENFKILFTEILKIIPKIKIAP